MEYEEIIKIITEDTIMREEIIYWLSDNGYLDDYKIGVVGFED